MSSIVHFLLLAWQVLAFVSRSPYLSISQRISVHPCGCRVECSVMRLYILNQDGSVTEGNI
eukprot:967797-Ditylum_brightwellii.AAC.1